MKNLIRTYFKTASAINSKMAANHAFELFQKPLNKKVRTKEKSFFKVAKKFKIKSPLEDIICYELGNPGGKMVLLVHGWESNAASMSGIGLKLAEAGYHVILFNLPAHGESKLKKLNLKIAKETFLEVLHHLNPMQPFSVVAHSFGSAVTSYALSKSTYHAEQLIFLTSPNKITRVFDDFSKFIGLNERAGSHLKQMASNLLKEPLEKVNVQDLGRKIRYDRLLLIHDEGDKVIPKEWSIDIYNRWDRAELHFIQNSGHYRMLWDTKVIDKITETLNDNKTNREDDRSLYAMAF